TDDMSWQWAQSRAAPAQVLICLTIPGLAVACTTAGPGPRTQPSALSAVRLTGYRSVSTLGTSGAVTVALTPAGSQHILGLIQALPKGSGPGCVEPPDLVYRVIVAHATGLVTGTVISGYGAGRRLASPSRDRRRPGIPIPAAVWTRPYAV